CHANCLLPLDGQLLLTVFTLSPGRREEKRLSRAWRYEGKVLRLDWASKSYEILYQPLAQPHSLVCREEQLYCCESIYSRLTYVSFEIGDTRALFHYPYGFARGLAFANGSAFVGISRHRRRGPLTRWLRGLLNVQCGVLELDPESWRVKRGFRLPGKEVYDIPPPGRALSQPGAPPPARPPPRAPPPPHARGPT